LLAEIWQECAALNTRDRAVASGPYSLIFFGFLISFLGDLPLDMPAPFIF